MLLRLLPWLFYPGVVAATFGLFAWLLAWPAPLLLATYLPVLLAGTLVTSMAQEGAFGTWLRERDVCDPSLMFGTAGVLEVASCKWLSEPGLGLTPRVSS